MLLLSIVMTKLNPDQQKAVVHQSGPAIVLAGAGSGKTTVLTHRVAWLISEKNVDPHNIILVTFTNKAAGEMKDRVRQLTGFDLPLSGTFHSICARILRAHGHHIGLDNNFLIFDTNDQLALIKQIYKDHGFSTKDFKPQAVKATISNNKNELISWQDYQNMTYGRYQEHVAKVYKIYQHKLADIGAVDFDDLLNQTIDLFNQSEFVLNKYQQQLEHVLVDEYQDTNKAQYLISKMLSAPHNNIYVVGDFSQSIYAWRGADYRNMMMMKTDFKDTAEYRLEQNYRSHQSILDAATSIISQNTSHPILKLWTDKKHQSKIVVHETNDRTDEANQVVNYIRDNLTEYTLKDIAILYRTNAQSRSFEEAFVKNRIPYRVVGGMKFYERKEIKDLLAYLKLLVNDKDTVSENRAIKLGKRKFAQYVEWKNTILKNYNYDELEPLQLIKEIIEVTGYDKKYDPKDPDDQSRLENIQELLRVAGQFTDVVQFLENIALIQNDQLVDVVDLDEADNVVTLMSFHAAKGLEFPIVFMVGMEDGLLPHSRSMLDKDQMEEERRLCYVGITRAKDKLYMTYAKKQFGYNGATSHIQSRFLHDIPPELIEPHSSASHYENRTYSSNNFYPKKKKEKPTPQPKRKYVPIDDDDLEGVLSGDLDIEKFLNS